MDLENSLTAAVKDFSIFKRQKNILISLVSFPPILSIGLPAVIWLLITVRSIPTGVITVLLNAFSFYFVILACFLPITLASYSIVGEKIEKSLEPLLATPITDSEFLFGKSLAAFLPSIAATYAGIVIFMPLADALTYNKLGYLFFLNGTMTVILLLTLPLSCMLSVEMNVIISSRVNDLRTAAELGALVLLPFGAIYVLSELDFIPLNEVNLLMISVFVAAVDVFLFYLSRITFRREEILAESKQE
ncbi:MAG: ABC transporter permease subunit [Theionarchaea archaeon]|nr:ABC transporter permease subunit [Theionarchaea archaeon]